MGRGRRIGMAAMAALLPSAVAGQLVERTVCQNGVDPVGSLGITGIACERCTFSTNGKVHQAVFWTEPTVEELDESMPAARVLKKGDVLVAVDGQLITTREGSARFSALPPDQEAHLRIRRNGKLMDVSVPVAKVCSTMARVDLPVVVGRPVPVDVVVPGISVSANVSVPQAQRVGDGVKLPGSSIRVSPADSVPPVPAVTVAPAAPSASVNLVAPVLPAAPPELAAPHASLGFGFRCSWCGWRSVENGGAGRWEFRDPPEVVGLSSSTKGAGGLEIGDRIIELDGVPLTDEEGGRRFAAILPGEELTWTVLREGRRVTARSKAGKLEQDGMSVGMSVTRDVPAPLRFSGTVGNTTIEVRGGRVTVSEDEGGRLVIIRAGDTEIRIRTPRDSR